MDLSTEVDGILRERAVLIGHRLNFAAECHSVLLFDDVDLAFNIDHVFDLTTKLQLLIEFLVELPVFALGKFQEVHQEFARLQHFTPINTSQEPIVHLLSLLRF